MRKLNWGRWESPILYSYWFDFVEMTGVGGALLSSGKAILAALVLIVMFLLEAGLSEAARLALFTCISKVSET